MAGLRIGIHTSRSGSLEKAAIRAYERGANSLQIFSSSPRIWRAADPDKEAVDGFRKARERFDLQPLAIHGSYLINLASLDPIIRPKSIAAFRGELQRAVAIGADYLVTHPGNYTSGSSEEGMAAFVLGLRDAAQGLDLGKLMVLLENTVGAGAQLGGTLAELRNMRDLARQLCDVGVGYCLDTCHLYAAGFDIAASRGLEDAVAAVERVLGMENVHLIHANDSKGALGSRRDRHANIGRGSIGLDGFGRILRHPGLQSKTFILETPEDEEGDQHRDVATLKRLAAGASAKKRKKKKENAGKAVQLSGN